MGRIIAILLWAASISGFPYHSVSSQDLGPGEWILVNEAAAWPARAGLQAVYFRDQMFVMGGRTPNPPGDPVIPGDSRIWNDVWVSSDLGETWELLLPHDSTDLLHWPARAYFQAVTLRDSIYVMGGQNFRSEPNPDCPPPYTGCSPFLSSSDFFNDVWRSGDGVHWELMTDSAGWSGRAGFSAAVFGNEIYVMGGSINDDAAIIGGPPSRIYLNDVWKSSNGRDWVRLAENAPWEKRAGGVAAVKDGHLYLFGGEEGFVCLPGSPCPPYFNDVWRTANGIVWEEINPSAPWKKRPGHQVVVLDAYFVLFGGFGLSPDIFDPFAAANPRDVWVSQDGADWTRISRRPWNALTQEEIKYDFDALSLVDPGSGQAVGFTFGGDRESFDFTDPLNYLNVDNDVWKFCLDACAVISSATAGYTGRSDLTAFPNPAVSELYLDVSGLAGQSFRYRIIDQAGRVVRQGKAGRAPGSGFLKLSVNDLAPGMYMLTVSDGNTPLNVRFIR